MCDGVWVVVCVGVEGVRVGVCVEVRVLDRCACVVRDSTPSQQFGKVDNRGGYPGCKVS